MTKSYFRCMADLAAVENGAVKASCAATLGDDYKNTAISVGAIHAETTFRASTVLRAWHRAQVASRSKKKP